MRFTCSSFFKLSLVFLSATLLSACGFHLRGDYDVPDELSKLSITSYDQYSSFTRIVTRQLRMNEIEIVQPADDVPNVHLISEGISERTLSLYQTTRAAEKELTFRASYRVTVPDIGTKTFSTSVTRSYLDNPLTALAKSVERDMIEGEMRKLAATQIVRQMGRLKASIQAGTMDEISEAEESAKVPTTNESYLIDTIETHQEPSAQTTAE
ncbi:LPS assembly lipoprotein LptE [Vibrio plantisponsor]|uniref:LPS-assembly lipoprotein LptE n=1 Tax=Vibrio plantisponsor TaxID=664643 RepID=A0ABU4IDM6_9VIBR|nr:LPS assembly lipoprotein LptE [Vibrio plantisponsor]MDW6016403.1 LPS assembly lipoprotein LptE [Vibrio plantisponsor]NNM41598.1 luciferase [Vibrio plantisponsor]